MIKETLKNLLDSARRMAGLWMADETESILDKFLVDGTITDEAFVLFMTALDDKKIMSNKRNIYGGSEIFWHNKDESFTYYLNDKGEYYRLNRSNNNTEKLEVSV